MISTIQHLQAERQTVERFLAETPEESLIERYSWQARLQDLEQEIEAARVAVEPKRAIITYRGRPVVGSRGIFSAFGLQATRAYTNAVQQLAAAYNRVEPLGGRGLVPGARTYDLLITGTAVGSFGFEMEEKLDPQLTLEERSRVSSALLQAQRLLLDSAIVSDDELTEAINGIDQRAINALRVFLKILAHNDATCAIETDQSRFHFDEVGEVNRSLSRLEAKNIVRQEEILEGEFAGLLPTPRTFEFKLEASGETVVGKINPDVADIADINRHLNAPARVRAISHRVGQGRARYVLIQNPQWLNEVD